MDAKPMDARLSFKVEPLFTNADLRKLIVPLVLEQLLVMTVGMADTMMVSSVGEAAISGVSLVDMVNMLIFSVLAALSTGGAVVTSQYLGARDEKAARNSARQLLYTVVVASCAVAFLAIVLRKPLLRLLFGKIEDSVMRNALIYLVISALSFPFLGLYNACASLFRSMGKASVTFRASLIINAINVGGNALCIFVLKMGVAGVAIPSLVSRMVGAVILYAQLRRKPESARTAERSLGAERTLGAGQSTEPGPNAGQAEQSPKGQIYLEGGAFHWDFREVRKILHIGIPSGVENGLFQLGRVMVVSIISAFGTVQIAANGVANNLDAMGVLIGNAMNLAMITVVGQCVGAKDEAQIRHYTKKLLAIAYAGTWGVVGLLTLFLNPILSLYGLGAETTGLARTLVLIHNLCAAVLWPLSFTLPNMLRASNDVRFTMVVSVLSMFLFRVFFGWLLGAVFGMGAIGVWIAMVLDWLCRITCFVTRYLRGSWRHLAGLDAE